MSTSSTVKITAEAAKLSYSPLVELYTIDATTLGMGTPIRYHNYNVGSGSYVVFKGETYHPFPLEVKGYEFRTSGELARPTLKLANISATISTLCILYNDLVGAKVTRRRTFARFLDYLLEPAYPIFISYGTIGDVATEFEDRGTIADSATDFDDFGTIEPNTAVDNPDADPDAEYPADIFYIDRKVSENRQTVEFEMGTSLDVEGIRLPLRVVTGDTCLWLYRGAECGFAKNIFVADENDNKSLAVITNWRGEYDEATTYAPGDGVSITSEINQTIYAAKPGTNLPFRGSATRPPNSTYWVVDKCSKRINGCALRYDPTKINSVLPFGGFPGTSNMS